MKQIKYRYRGGQVLVSTIPSPGPQSPLARYCQNDEFALLFDDFEITDQRIDDAIQTQGSPSVITNNFYSKLDLRHQVYCHPGALYSCTVPIVRAATIDQDTRLVTDYCSNFMLNRKRVNRFLLAKLVEWFDLKSVDYTYSGVDANFDMTHIIAEFDSISAPPWASNFKSAMLAPSTLPAKWISVAGDTVKKLIQIVPAGNAQVWNSGIDQLFSRSAVSLITESIDYQAGAGYTEKTGFAVLGRTFPIWIGGKYQADEFARLGYDTFDDVIDHSYQYKDTLIERCYHAIADNLDILTDIDLARATRDSMQLRLTKNQSQLVTDCSSPDQVINRLIASIQHFDEPAKILTEQHIRIMHGGSKL